MYLLLIYLLVWQGNYFKGINVIAVGMNGCRVNRKLGKSNQNPACVQNVKVRIGMFRERNKPRKHNSSFLTMIYSYGLGAIDNSLCTIVK